MGDESAAGSAGEAFGDFMTRAARIEGLTKAKVLQGIGDVLQMEQILGPREWGENAGVVQIARLKAKIQECSIDFTEFDTSTSYNRKEAEWWEEVGLAVAQRIASKMGKAQGNMVPSKYSKEVVAGQILTSQGAGVRRTRTHYTPGICDFVDC